MGSHRFGVIEKLHIYNGRPVCRKLEVPDGMSCKYEVLGGNLLAITPHNPLFEVHLGSPESLTAHHFFFHRGRKISSQRRHPIVILVRITEEGRLASPQHIK